MKPDATTCTTPKRHAWRIASALAMAVALLPAAAAAVGTQAQLHAATAERAQELPATDRHADATNVASAGPLRTLAGSDKDADILSAADRRLLMRKRRFQRRRFVPRSRPTPVVRGSPVVRRRPRANPGRPRWLGRSRRGRMRRSFPPTPQGEAQCRVSAVVEEVEYYDADFLHATAIAELFEMVCSEPDDLTLDNLVEVFIERDAFAFAEATAAAVVDCQSTDEDAFLCASVTATARAFAETVVTAHVEATATAIRGCGCQDEITGFGTSETFISLVAEATATATASACIQGTGRVVNTAYSTCTSSVFARVFARAGAQAIIEGNCLNGQAVAQLLLEADAMDVTAGSTCDGIAEVNVTPGASTYEDTYDGYY